MKKKKTKYLLLISFLFTSIFTSCNKTSYDIMIVGINSNDFIEVDVLIDNLESKKKETIDNVNFYVGKIENKSVVIAETKVGLSASAMATTIGIKQYNPKIVICEGTSGGHHSEVSNNHIILGKSVINVNSYKGDGADPSTWDLLFSPLYSDNRLLEIASNTPYFLQLPIKKDGIIASSNAWNEKKEFINKMHSKFNEDCEEMESYAVVKVCYNYSIPSLTIRIISNNVITDEDYDPVASKNLQKYVIDVVKQIS